MKGRSNPVFWTAVPLVLILTMRLLSVIARADIDLDLIEKGLRRVHHGTSYDYAYEVDRSVRSTLAPTGGGTASNSIDERSLSLLDVFGPVSGRGDRSSLAAVVTPSWPLIEALDTPPSQLRDDDPDPNRAIFRSGGSASLSAGLNPLFSGLVSLGSTNPLAGTSISSYSGASQRASNLSLIASNSKPLLSPRQNAVPEPTGLALCGLGLLGLALYRWRVRRAIDYFARHQ